MNDILSLLQDFNVANFLPEPEQFLKSLEGWTRVIVLLGPVIVLILGLWYYFRPPKEANHSVGFRTYWGMGSISAWRFTQKLAGICYMALGGVLTVLMLLVSLFFKGDSAQAMINAALVCVIIEFVLIFLTWLVINFVVYKTYDKNGKRRK